MNPTGCGERQHAMKDSIGRQSEVQRSHFDEAKREQRVLLPLLCTEVLNVDGERRKGKGDACPEESATGPGAEHRLGKKADLDVTSLVAPSPTLALRHDPNVGAGHHACEIKSA